MRCQSILSKKSKISPVLPSAELAQSVSIKMKVHRRSRTILIRIERIEVGLKIC